MADRVHPMPPSPPRHPAPPPAKDPDHDAAAATETTPLHPAAAAKPAYIVQIPKDQVLRVPPPDRARRYKSLSSRPARRRRRRLRRACCSACALLLLLLLAAAAFLAAVFLVFRPKPPSFSLSSLNLKGLNSSSVVSGSVLVRADNGRNGKVAVEYLSGGVVELSSSYDDGGGSPPVAVGPWPAFVQAPRNVTDFAVAMAATGARLGGEEQRGRKVEARVPVRLRFGETLLRTWAVDVKATCEVTVAGGEAAAGSRGCRVKVRPFLWWWWW